MRESQRALSRASAKLVILQVVFCAEHKKIFFVAAPHESAGADFIMIRPPCQAKSDV